MNKTYRNIWNTATGTWTAVAETARSRSKGSARAARQAVAALALGSASIGGAFAADACTTEDGKAGSVDAAGICQIANTMGTWPIGTMAGPNSYEAGTGANASGGTSVAVGVNSAATATSTTALGYAASATTHWAIAIGSTSSASGESAIALGTVANATGDNSLAIGASTRATDTNSIALGNGAASTGANATAIGRLATAGAVNTTVLGGSANATGTNATAVGQSSAASGLSAVGIGFRANAQADNSVALGTDSVANRTNTVSVGSATRQRQVVNVAAGTQATDAVNVSQLQPVVTALGGGATIDPTTGAVTGPTYTLTNGGAQTTVGGALGALDGALTTANGNIARNTGDITTINTKLDGLSNGTVGLVQQSAPGADLTVGASTDGAAVNFTGTAGARKLTGVDAGAVTASSTDAVNGSQLHGVADSIASAIGGGSVVNTDGSISAPSFTLGDGSGGTTTVHSVGGAVTNLDGRVTTNEGAIASLADQIGNGTVGLVQQAAAGADITVGASTDGAAVDFTGTAGARKLTGVDAGAVTASSTDAVNGSQLHGVADSVASAIGGGSVVNTDGSISAPSFTLGDGSGGTTTVTSVGGAVTNLDGRVTTNEGDIASLADQIGNGTVGLVQQAGAGANITVGANTDGAAVDFTGTAGARKLTGVDAGAVTASSTDAVNGSQLHGVSDSVASAIGGGSVVNPDGSISAPGFTVGDGSGGTTTVRSVGDAVTNLDGRVTTNEGAIASLADQIGNGTAGLVQQAGPGANLTVGANTDGTAVSFIGTAGARTLSGVANGVNDDDAVTIAQLKATGLIDYTGKEIAAVTYDDVSLASVTFGGSAGTKLLNVAPGLIAAGSMEAVNGGQLYDLQERFAQEYARLDGRVGDLEAGGGPGGGGGGGGNVGPGTGGEGSLVVGDGAAASGENSSAIGQGSAASGDGSTAVGQGSNASGGNSSAIGQGAVASGDSSTAIGQGSSATGSGSVAIGAGSVATEANTVSFGDGTAEGNRRLVNIADGVNASDAATKGQLDRAINGMQGQINDVAKNAYAGVAAAMAMPNLTPSQPGKTVVAAGAANYKSGSAIAAGATYRTRDGKWLMNGAVSVTSTGDAGVRAQVGYEF
ncbi:ESPR-type extended signal peptide-containing protein [Burkholderia sp. BCC0405]|uniref:ESPR-type extended signal peptide-containing protein n=1 Tax=Burkholderia sp. BCC0405 TaxID=2676298 RepID=UPI00158A1F0F|nr:ESPR-type extended signal peptide-containing protein [Burkholderia sp. BCC0405]